jgi:hypothetical protein
MSKISIGIYYYSLCLIKFKPIFPPEQFPLLGKDVVEGRVDVLALFAERFPESVGEMINRAEHIGPTVQKELNEIFTTTTQKMERPHVLARIEELRPLFKLTNTIEARMPMMAMTMRSSIRVNPFVFFIFSPPLSLCL